MLKRSTRSEPVRHSQLAAEVRAFLGGRGIEISGEQPTKMRKALECFLDLRAVKLDPRTP